MEKVKFVFLELDGKSEILNFINGLPSKNKAKLYDVIKSISEFGISIASRQEWVKKLILIYMKFVLNMATIFKDVCIFISMRIHM